MKHQENTVNMADVAAHFATVQQADQAVNQFASMEDVAQEFGHSSNVDKVITMADVARHFAK